MPRRLSLSILLAAMGAIVLAQSKVTIPVPRTHAENGRQMYASYCAPCHGVDGRGHGPAAAALKTPPPDLTIMSRNNHGTYPTRHVVAVLEFGMQATAHGSKEMPVWGPVLAGLDHPGSARDTQALRIHNLARYIQTLQVK